MKRTLATACTVTLLALSVAGCGGNDSGGAAAKSQPDTQTTAASESTSSTPSETASDLPSATPTDLSTDLPSATSSAVPAGGGVDGCALVNEQLLTTDLGFAGGGQLLSQPSSFGDPASKDCYYAASNGDLVVVKATGRASTDMPESSYGVGSLPGAKPIDGVDWGFVYLLSSGPTVASVAFVKGETGLDMSITTQGAASIEDYQKFAADVVAELG